MNPFTLFVIRIRAINSYNFLSIPLKKPTKRTLSFNRRTLNLRAPFINFFRSVHRSKIFHSNVELNCKQKKNLKKRERKKKYEKKIKKKERNLTICLHVRNNETGNRIVSIHRFVSAHVCAFNEL